MALSRDEVRHIAQLARVGVTEEDVSRFQAQLSVILDHFAALGEIDTSGVPPTAHTLPLANIERDDTSRPSCPTESVLANAPRKQDAFLRVRKVLE
ncbi:MAG TPA: Asp-tRNA(Asn)/Glu-tRNA(Gln) amidotransferase subunit GatC [Dehalococcoidia bacterium]|nr:Asp-tRNA(Asn)/Glu-tRNA(Gln) amidotransferase subunit GatC [Dehalococcoidia bacterium]